MAVKYFATFCPACDKDVDAFLVSRPATIKVFDELVDITETVAVCPDCGIIIGDARIEGENLDRAYEAYRERYGKILREVEDWRSGNLETYTLDEVRSHCGI